MNLLVLGASGGCGGHVVRQALAAGHAVTAIVRPSTVYAAPPGAVVVRDDVLRDGAIAAVARGHDAVISCLGIRRRRPRNPWSRLISPPDFTSRTAAAIVAAMRAARIERVLAISAAGVADSAPRMSWLLRFLFAHSRVGDAYRDLAAMEDVYARSALDWIAVRPVTLTNRRARAVGEIDRFGLAATISREAVARWLIEHVGSTPTTRTPMIEGRGAPPIMAEADRGAPGVGRGPRPDAQLSPDEPRV
jgi:putative NADH-flavin reductase